MIRTSKKWFIFLTLICISFSQAVGQVVKITYEKRILSTDQKTFTFDVRATKGTGYDVSNQNNSNWQFMNIRSDVEVPGPVPPDPAAITITSATIAINPAFLSDGAVNTSIPGSPLGGPTWREFSIDLIRDNQPDIPDGTGALIGTVTLTFSGPVLSSNKVSIRPFDGTTFRAFWTNLDFNAGRRPIEGTFNQVLPVSLIDFSTAREGSIATLSWSTSEESNSDYFEIQRSGDGKDWGKLKSLPAKGESVVEAHYSAVDDSPLGGNNFYRLKMVDKDGTFAFSQIRNLKFEQKEGFTLFPNPVSDKLNFKSEEDWKNVSSVKIYNAQGVEVYTSPLVPEKEVNVKSLPAGLYVAKLSKRNGQYKAYRITIAR
ncbi:hypothetical protein GCM10010967_19180 [Dyadobacter beijingensis]|uniref:Secretion system C-terminal sorting domain-containing protein n=1 Tax=Dyadobacter beijingensis TaxID=365489 RepID=A0ABQ2HQA5_9BACT|nr:T9SS type A sorting domain-containing protein [Dyadobacter beijingensis]GGM86957.1 hypothetical protein GCM10010967_19180 [Dyadobacter beijingensis]